MSASPSPTEVLFDLSTVHMAGRALQVVAEMGIADVLGDEPASTDALAHQVKAHPQALARVLRLLGTYGIFEEAGGKFRHTPASRLMRTDDPNSMRPWIRMMGMPLNWSSYGAFEQAVRTGISARSLFTNGDFFTDYLPKHPHEAKLFDEAMSANAHRRVQSITEAYDFSPFATIADIGGGRGHLIRGVLEATPSVKGILFDLPHAVEPTRALNVPRLTVMGGDFFKDALPKADLYILMAVIHDWGDEESTKILGAVRKAAPSPAKLILIERVIREGPEERMGRRLDIHMLAAHSGRERTLAEFRDLYAATGFSLDRVVTTASGASMIEGSLAG